MQNKNVIILIILIAIAVIGYLVVGKNQQAKKDSYPTFVQQMIDEDAMIDAVYQYDYKNGRYFYFSGWEKVDGTPRVIGFSGNEIECNFKNPMVPVSETDPNAKPVNPICAAYTTGTIIYQRN